MTKILLLSDTHGYCDERILHYANECDEIWHAGDVGSWDIIEKLNQIKPVFAVYGNIDGGDVRKTLPEKLIRQVENVKICIVHIGGYPGKYATKIKQWIAAEKPSIFICGHSHILKVQYDQQYHCLTLNPGAAGIYGFHQVRTMLRFEIEGDKIQNMEVIELGKKSK